MQRLGFDSFSFKGRFSLSLPIDVFIFRSTVLILDQLIIGWRGFGLILITVKVLLYSYFVFIL